MFRKKLSRLVGLLCAAVLVTGGTMVSYGAEGNASQNALRVFSGPVEKQGEQLAVNPDYMGQPMPQVMLNITDTTLILDAVSGFPTAFEDIKDGEFVYAYVGDAMTLSLPPITNATVIITNIPADFKAPTLEIVNTLVKETDGNAVVETTGGLEYTVTPETSIIPYLTRQMVTVDNLEPGTKFLVWTTTAQPETAYKIMIFMDGQIDITGMGQTQAATPGEGNTPSNGTTIDGTTIDSATGPAMDTIPATLIEDSIENTNETAADDAVVSAFPGVPVQEAKEQPRGWVYDDGHWFYYNDDGTVQGGWLLYEGSWYYLDPVSGIMETGFLTLDDKTYYLLPDGRLLMEPMTFTPDSGGALQGQV